MSRYQEKPFAIGCRFVSVLDDIDARISALEGRGRKTATEDGATIDDLQGKLDSAERAFESRTAAFMAFRKSVASLLQMEEEDPSAAEVLSALTAFAKDAAAWRNSDRILDEVIEALGIQWPKPTVMCVKGRIADLQREAGSARRLRESGVEVARLRDAFRRRAEDAEKEVAELKAQLEKATMRVGQLMSEGGRDIAKEIVEEVRRQDAQLRADSEWLHRFRHANGASMTTDERSRMADIACRITGEEVPF